ncbi:397_t:CDS:2 [Funneliformis mosseae]|uniref:397_t:CDS:1 n=1 Tax=Funneliformis mosseae TaxID=27381 RepID=A0A9N8YSV4_FUNMO|nr:397_t:CDS:2 [Funneliformis mosseae]
MLLGWLHEKIFPDNYSNVPVQAEVVEIALKHLDHKAEHFWNIGECKAKNIED